MIGIEVVTTSQKDSGNSTFFLSILHFEAFFSMKLLQKNLNKFILRAKSIHRLSREDAILIRIRY